MPGPFDPAAGRLSGQVSASNSKTRGKGTANGMALRAVFYPAFPRWANLCRASLRRCRRQLLRVKRLWWVGGMPVARRSLREGSDRREILEYVSDFFSRSKVAFAKRKNSCTEEWAGAETGGHAYRRGTVLVLARRDDLGGQFGGLVGGRASKSALFENRSVRPASAPRSEPNRWESFRFFALLGRINVRMILPRQSVNLFHNLLVLRAIQFRSAKFHP